jgi:hypothetical protein
MEYDAFISYSHFGERQLARDFEQTLWTFGRSWHQIRGIRTYRDETNLAAEPDLWPAIEKAVRNSGCLVLLASPDSARSVWVPREIQACVETHGLAGLCIVQTAGVLPWTDRITPEEMAERSDAAVDASVLSLFTAANATPLVVDLRPFRSMKDSERRKNADYLSRVASVAAKVLGTDKEVLWGEYHRVERFRSAFLAAVSVVLLGLMVTLAVVLQADVTQTQRAETALAEASAGLIWSKLGVASNSPQDLWSRMEEDDTGALWDLATAETQVRTAFLSQLLVSPTFIVKFSQIPDPILRAFGLRLAPEQAEEFLSAALRVFSAQPAELRETVRALAPDLSPKQAQLALTALLKIYNRDPGFLWPGRGTVTMYVATVEALVPRLAPDQVWAALPPVLDSLQREFFFDPAALAIVTALTPSLSVEQARTMLHVVQNTRFPVPPTDQEAAVKALAARVNPSPASKSVDRAVPPKGATESQHGPPSKDSKPVNSVLSALRSGRDHPDYVTAATAARKLVALAPTLTPSATEDALNALIPALAPFIDGPPTANSESVLAENMEAFAPNVPAHLQPRLLNIARAGLGAAKSAEGAMVWSKVINTLLQPSPPGDYFAGVIDTLKYPASTLHTYLDPFSSASDYLLVMMRQRLMDTKWESRLKQRITQRAKGFSTLREVLDVVAKRYPKIDLRGPPARPAPLAAAVVADR